MSYEKHFIAGREDDASAVAAVLTEARDATGVVLYFHGGLSSETYMREKLGKWLMESFFLDENRDGLYPIFVTYDASVFDLEKLRDFLGDSTVGRIVDRLKDRFTRGHDKSLGTPTLEQELALAQDAARELLTSGLNKSTLNEEDIARLLSDEAAQTQLATSVLEAEPALAEVATELSEVVASKGVAVKGVIDYLNILPKTITKSAARFLLRTNHEFVPTLVEQLIRELVLMGVDLGDFTQHHWNTVYERAEACWQSDKNGRRLMEGLAALRAEKTAVGQSYKIHTLSHSAGSIATGHLVSYLAESNGPKLDNIIMLAPAINQKLFAETVIAHPETYECFRAFVLNEDREEGDQLVKHLYPASLLYFVSGVAEEKGHADRMLLIARHLDEGRGPYRKMWYRKWLGRDQGDPRKVWAYFAADPSRRVNCPDHSDDPRRRNDGTGHENTKYPWVTRELGRAVWHLLTDGRVTAPTFPVPDGAPVS